MLYFASLVPFPGIAYQEGETKTLFQGCDLQREMERERLGPHAPA